MQDNQLLVELFEEGKKKGYVPVKRILELNEQVLIHVVLIIKEFGQFL